MDCHLTHGLYKDLVPDSAEVWFPWGAVCELALTFSCVQFGA